MAGGAGEDRWQRTRPCSAHFSVSHGGLNDIEKHLKTKKHSSICEASSSTQSIASFFASTSKSSLSVIRAETLFTDFIIEHSLPIRVADHASKLFTKMFPDSGIAKKYSSGRTKTSYIAETLGTHSMSNILDIIRVSPFSMATDGSTDYEDGRIMVIPAL